MVMSKVTVAAVVAAAVALATTVAIAVAAPAAAATGEVSWPSPPAEYLAARQALVDAYRARRFDANTTMDADERAVNATIMQMKMVARRAHVFAPAMPFLQVKDQVQASPLFDALLTMPKGAILHLHADAGADTQWLIGNVTHRPNCYFNTGGPKPPPAFPPPLVPPTRAQVAQAFAVAYTAHLMDSGTAPRECVAAGDAARNNTRHPCWRHETDRTRHGAMDGSPRQRAAEAAVAAHVLGIKPASGMGAVPDESMLYGAFVFFDPAPPSDVWTSCSDMRASWVPGMHGFDTFDDYAVSLVSIDMAEFNATEDAWAHFQPYFSRDLVLMYKPVFQEYCDRIFSRAAEEGVNYVELRTGGLTMYSLDHKAVYTNADSLELIVDVANMVAKRDAANFMGAASIASGFRESTYDQLHTFAEASLALRVQRPDVIVGFDIAGQEDLGYNLLDYAGIFLELTANASAANTTMPFALHVGETDWGMNEAQPAPQNISARNLFDAAALKAKRLGHGLALAKFPTLIEEFVSRGVALEVCPLSNQELQMVEDLRDHPATSLLTAGMAVTISPDDPTPLNDGYVTYDWWMALVAWDVDLASLKAMAYNSVMHTFLDEASQDNLLALWSKQWQQWIGGFHEQPAVKAFLREQARARGSEADL